MRLDASYMLGILKLDFSEFLIRKLPLADALRFGSL